MTRRGLFAMLAGLPLGRRIRPAVSKPLSLARLDWYSREALRVLGKNLEFHAPITPRRKVGDTVTVRMPARFRSTISE